MNNRPAHRGKPLSLLLKMAVLAGIQAAVHIRIRKGDDVNAIDGNGRSALILAASRGDSETCRILLEAGADPHILDKDGNNALSFAKDAGRIELASLLSQYLSVSPETKTGEKPASDDSTIAGSPTDEIFIDLSVWEAEEETRPPPDDGTCRANAYALQRDISAHAPIDVDED